MLTEEEIGQEIGLRLRAEVSDISVPRDLAERIRRRRDRRLASTRGGLAAGGAALIAAAAVAAAVGPGSTTGHGRAAGPTARHSVAAKPTGDQVIRLDGYQVKLPANMPVRRIGAGYLVGSHATGYFTIFLERGPNLGPTLARAHGLTVHRVRVGIRSAWWAGTSHGGELWVQVMAMPREFLVAKVLGAGEAAAVRFAEGLAVTWTPVVHVSCSTSCG